MVGGRRIGGTGGLAGVVFVGKAVAIYADSQPTGDVKGGMENVLATGT